MMESDELINHLMNNQLSPDEKILLFNMIENNRTAKIALKVNAFFLMGHPLSKSSNGAYKVASDELGVSVPTCQRCYNKLYPKRMLTIETKIKPALSFPIL